MTILTEKEQEFRDRFHEYTRTLDCVHCGLCIPFCPTHGITGREASSPRGRIYLMRGWAEGEGALTAEAKRHLDECIVCRACETVCPSGIRMGDMMESFREEVARESPRRGWRYRLGRMLLRDVIPSRERIAMLTDVLWVFQKTGLRRLAGFFLRLVSKRLAYLDSLQPTVLSPSERRIPTDRYLSKGYYPAHGPARMRVGLFLGCIASEWFASTHRATIRVLQRNGCDVLVPDSQTCCGALHRHGGFLDDAAELYRQNRDAFREAGADVLAVNAAGCGAALKEPPASMADGVGVPVRDIFELLDEIGIVRPERPVAKRVVYDQPCHLLHGQGVGAPAVEGILRQIPGVELLPLPDSDRCCGSGGAYNLAHPELAKAVRDEKVAAIRAVAPDIVVTGNPGCILQIRSGLRGTGSGLRGTAIEVMHPVDLLDRGYSGES